MKKNPQDAIDAYIRRAIRLNQAIEGEVEIHARKVKMMYSKVIEKISKDFEGIKMSSLRELQRSIIDEITKEYENLYYDEEKIIKQVIKKESVWNKETLLSFAAEFDEKFNNINLTNVAAATISKSFQGHTFSYWFKHGGKSASKAINGLLMDGYIKGLTTDQVVKSIMAYTNKPISDVRTLTRSFLQSAAHEAKYQTGVDNSDIIDGYQWISVLDNRTTPLICGIRDMLLYDKKFQPVGHKLPWSSGPGRIHFNCRSTFIFQIVGFDWETTRPAIFAGDEYDRGDKYTATGKVRKPTKPNREKGIYEIKQVSSSTTYESFLKRQPHDFVADVLGSEEKATEFLSGKRRLADFASSAAKTSVEAL